MKNIKFKNRKAFTLVEVIAVIIIIGILLVIAVPSFTRVVRTAELNYYWNQEKSILISGRSYFT
ncbi:MAG: prepilin-type N-terminal cleavage/methylation domain-containing protein, partial [Bacilli bacterium]|nr:prepilin-type N-terminal cleavage/methylation domain-containing protein [Bacilli bacterium]